MLSGATPFQNPFYEKCFVAISADDAFYDKKEIQGVSSDVAS